MSYLQKFIEVNKESMYKVQRELSFLPVVLEEIQAQEVFIQMNNSVQAAFTFFYLIDHGFCPFMLPNKLPGIQLENLKKQNKSSSFLIQDELKQKGEKKNELKGCYGCFSSGSTGKPKKYYFKVENAINNARLHGESLGITSTHQILQSLPLHHSFGIISYLFTSLVFESELIFNEVFLGLRSLKKMDLSQSILHISPAQLRFMLKEKVEILSGIDIVSIGGGVSNHDEISQIQQKIPCAQVFKTYGITEAGPRISTLKWSNDSKEKSVGYPLSGVKLEVLGEDKKIRREGLGRLLVKSKGLAINLSNSEKNEKGYLITSDLVDLSKDSEITFISRIDDIINVGGVNVFPAVIEEIVRDYSLVSDCIVIKKDNKVYGEVPVLIVEPKVEIKKLEEFIKDKLRVYEFPKEIYSFDELPRISINKIDRIRVKEMVS